MGVGWFLPWRSPTQTDKHPQAGLMLEWTQEEALGVPGDPTVHPLPLPSFWVTQRLGICRGLLFPQTWLHSF